MVQFKTIFFAFYLKRENILTVLCISWKANLVQKVTRVGTKGVEETQAAVLTSLLECLMRGQSMVKALLQACLIKCHLQNFRTMLIFQLSMLAPHGTNKLFSFI